MQFTHLYCLNTSVGRFLPCLKTALFQNSDHSLIAKQKPLRYSRKNAHQTVSKNNERFAPQRS